MATLPIPGIVARWFLQMCKRLFPMHFKNSGKVVAFVLLLRGVRIPLAAKRRAIVKTAFAAAIGGGR
jgi:hypothetical protein